MSGLPEGWESDYDGQRWFFRYKPTGIVQYTFPQLGDEFPQDFDSFAASAPIDLAPEEWLESHQQVKRIGGGNSATRERSSRLSANPAARKSRASGGVGASALPEADDEFGWDWRPDSFMYLGPGSYNDVSPINEEEDDKPAAENGDSNNKLDEGSKKAVDSSNRDGAVEPPSTAASPGTELLGIDRSRISPLTSAGGTPRAAPSEIAIAASQTSESPPVPSDSVKAAETRSANVQGSKSESVSPDPIQSERLLSAPIIAPIVASDVIKSEPVVFPPVTSASTVAPPAAVVSEIAGAAKPEPSASIAEADSTAINELASTAVAAGAATKDAEVASPEPGQQQTATANDGHDPNIHMLDSWERPFELPGMATTWSPLGSLAELPSESTAQCYEEIHPTPIELPGSELVYGGVQTSLYRQTAPVELWVEPLPPAAATSSEDQQPSSATPAAPVVVSSKSSEGEIQMAQVADNTAASQPLEPEVAPAPQQPLQQPSVQSTAAIDPPEPEVRAALQRPQPPRQSLPEVAREAVSARPQIGVAAHEPLSNSGDGNGKYQAWQPSLAHRDPPAQPVGVLTSATAGAVNAKRPPPKVPPKPRALGGTLKSQTKQPPAASTTAAAAAAAAAATQKSEGFSTEVQKTPSVLKPVRGRSDSTPKSQTDQTDQTDQGQSASTTTAASTPHAEGDTTSEVHKVPSVLKPARGRPVLTSSVTDRDTSASRQSFYMPQKAYMSVFGSAADTSTAVPDQLRPGVHRAITAPDELPARAAAPLVGQQQPGAGGLHHSLTTTAAPPMPPSASVPSDDVDTVGTMPPRTTVAEDRSAAAAVGGELTQDSGYTQGPPTESHPGSTSVTAPTTSTPPPPAPSDDLVNSSVGTVSQNQPPPQEEVHRGAVATLPLNNGSFQQTTEAPACNKSLANGETAIPVVTPPDPSSVVVSPAPSVSPSPPLETSSNFASSMSQVVMADRHNPTPQHANNTQAPRHPPLLAASSTPVPSPPPSGQGVQYCPYQNGPGFQPAPAELTQNTISPPPKNPLAPPIPAKVPMSEPEQPSRDQPAALAQPGQSTAQVSQTPAPAGMYSAGQYSVPHGPPPAPNPHRNTIGAPLTAVYAPLQTQSQGQSPPTSHGSPALSASSTHRLSLSSAQSAPVSTIASQSMHRHSISSQVSASSHGTTQQHTAPSPSVVQQSPFVAPAQGSLQQLQQPYQGQVMMSAGQPYSLPTQSLQVFYPFPAALMQAPYPAQRSGAQAPSASAAWNTQNPAWMAAYGHQQTQGVFNAVSWQGAPSGPVYFPQQQQQQQHHHQQPSMSAQHTRPGSGSSQSTASHTTTSASIASASGTTQAPAQVPAFGMQSFATQSSQMHLPAYQNQQSSQPMKQQLGQIALPPTGNQAVVGLASPGNAQLPASGQSVPHPMHAASGLGWTTSGQQQHQASQPFGSVQAPANTNGKPPQQDALATHQHHRQYAFPVQNPNAFHQHQQPQNAGQQQPHRQSVYGQTSSAMQQQPLQVQPAAQSQLHLGNQHYSATNQGVSSSASAVSVHPAAAGVSSAHNTGVPTQGQALASSGISSQGTVQPLEQQPTTLTQPQESQSSQQQPQAQSAQQQPPSALQQGHQLLQQRAQLMRLQGPEQSVPQPSTMATGQRQSISAQPFAGGPNPAARESIQYYQYQGMALPANMIPPSGQAPFYPIQNHQQFMSGAGSGGQGSQPPVIPPFGFQTQVPATGGVAQPAMATQQQPPTAATAAAPPGKAAAGSKGKRWFTKLFDSQPKTTSIQTHQISAPQLAPPDPEYTLAPPVTSIAANMLMQPQPPVLPQSQQAHQPQNPALQHFNPLGSHPVHLQPASPPQGLGPSATSAVPVSPVSMVFPGQPTGAARGPVDIGPQSPNGELTAGVSGLRMLPITRPKSQVIVPRPESVAADHPAASAGAAEGDAPAPAASEDTQTSPEGTAAPEAVVTGPAHPASTTTGQTPVDEACIVQPLFSGDGDDTTTPRSSLTAKPGDASPPATAAAATSYGQHLDVGQKTVDADGVSVDIDFEKPDNGWDTAAARPVSSAYDGAGWGK